MLNLFQSSLLLIAIFLSIYIISFYYTYYFYKNKLSYKQNDNNHNFLNNNHLIKNFMGFIFIIFGLLKLYDLPKFINIFSKYDFISKKFKSYGFAYPFIEIFIGILFIKNIFLIYISIITIILMAISIFSVLYSIINKQKLRCGCLGSFFHIPLSYITISENIIMFIMALRFLIF